MALKNIPALPHKADIDVVNDRVLVSVSDDDEPLDKNKGKLTSPQEMYRGLIDRYAFGALAVEDYDDPTAIAAAVADALELNTKRRTVLGPGDWYVSRGMVRSHSILGGAGGSGHSGERATRLRALNPETDEYILTPYQIWDEEDPTLATLDVHNIIIHDLVIDLEDRTDLIGFLMPRIYPKLISNVTLLRVAFTGTGGLTAPPQCWFQDDEQTGYGVALKLIDCMWETGGIGFQTDSSNFEISLDGPRFFIGGNAVGINAVAFGTLGIRNYLFEGTGSPAPSATLDRTLLASGGHAGINTEADSPNISFTAIPDGEFPCFIQDDEGNQIVIPNAGPGGTDLTTTIKEVQPTGRSAIMADNAGSTVSDEDISIYRWEHDTDKAYAGIQLSSERGMLQLNKGADEGLQHLIVCEGGFVDPALINGARIQSQILVKDGGFLNLATKACDMPSMLARVEDGGFLVHRSDSDEVRLTTPFGTTLNKSKIRDYAAGDGVYKLMSRTPFPGQFESPWPVATYNEPFDVLLGFEWAAMTRAGFRVGRIQRSYGESFYPILQLCELDPITNQPFGFDYNFWIKGDDGLLRIRGSQYGFSGLQFDGPMFSTPSAVSRTEGIVSMDCRLATAWTVTPTGPCSMQFIRPLDGCRYVLRVLTSGTTSYPLNFVGGQFVLNGPPVVETGTEDNKYFLFEFEADGTYLVEKARSGPMDMPYTPDQQTGLNLWAEINASTDPNSVTDLSGDDNHLIPTSGTGPALNDVGDGLWELRWDGTATYKPLKTPNGDHTITHIFLAAAADAANFPDYSGLCSAVSTAGMLVGNSGANTWFNLGIGSHYKKSGVPYAEGSASAPMNGVIEVISLSFDSPLTLPGGLLIASDRLLSGRVLDGALRGAILTFNNASMTSDEEDQNRLFVAHRAGVATV